MAWFVVGLLAGGLTSALVLWLASGLVAPVPAGWRYGIVLFAGVVAVLRDLGVVTLRLPQNARQIPQDVLRTGLVRGALQFGFELGTGVRTYVSASVPYVFALALLLTGQRWQVAVLAGLGFGAGRAASALARYASRGGEDWDARLAAWLRPIVVAGSTVLTVALGLLLLG
jgi:hypothetical protein